MSGDETDSAGLRAYEDLEFLKRDELRPVRLMLELMKAEMLQREADIRSTIVVFGSARIHSPSDARAQLTEACRVRDRNPGDAASEAAVSRAERALANAAYYDRVTIMATSRAPAVTASQMTPPTFQRPPPQPIDDNDEPININMPPQQQGNPVTGQFPGMPPQPGQMPVQTQPGAPIAPITSPRPGAVQQPPMPNGVPNPYQPVVRPPGVPGQTGRGGGPGGV